MLIDPKMDVIPDKLINWGTKEFVEFMMKKTLKFSQKLKGTKYEEKLKNSAESLEFYKWILGYIKDHCAEKGWKYLPPDI